jgi:hypothetical protein
MDAKKPHPGSENLILFKKGQSGNPGGKPSAERATRNRINAAFLKALCADFEENGEQAIENCRKRYPSAYIGILASLLPKEVTVSRPLEELADDELAASITYLRARIAESAGARADGAGEPQPAGELPPVH